MKFLRDQGYPPWEAPNFYDQKESRKKLKKHVAKTLTEEQSKEKIIVFYSSST